MTDDEKRQQKAMLLLECHEAEQELAHLQEKARRVSARLQAISEWLMQSVDHLGVPDTVNSSRMGHVNIREDSNFQLVMNFDAVANLADDLRKLRVRLSDLQKRKQLLGLK